MGLDLPAAGACCMVHACYLARVGAGRVLIVEGAIPMRKLYEFVLRRCGEGLDRVEAKDVLDARRQLDAHHFELAIVDVQSDERSYALIEELRARGVPVFARTESIEPWQERRASAAGAVRCFSIPFRTHELQALVENLLFGGGGDAVE